MNFNIVAVEQIIVPHERFREARPDKVAEIRESFRVYGQLQPVILERDFTLVDGMHRLAAARELKMPTIGAVFRDETDRIFLREIELEANIRRAEMVWQDRERAIAELHRMRTAANPNWGQMQTQQLAGLKRPDDVSQAIKLTRMMELFPEIAKAKSKNQALSWANAKAKHALRVYEVKENASDYSQIEERLILGDSVEVIKEIPDESFNAIVTDPPFGIDYDRRSEGQEGSLTSYKDDEESYLRLLSMAPDMHRVLKRDGWLIWFLGVSWYERVKTVFRSTGFLVDEIPIIWDRSDGRSFTSRPDRYFGRGYDIALHCIKGDPQIVVRGRSNVLRIPPVEADEREYLVERPIQLYEELINRLTVPNEIVADFFVGSGSCLAAAAKLRRNFFGVEQDPIRRAGAIKKIYANLPT
jgi:DNA modification methylase